MEQISYLNFYITDEADQYCERKPSHVICLETLAASKADFPDAVVNALLESR